ncbi:MAG: hypothetical protein EBR82_07960 [Caulobacteraceae bacterium]|nr:hypothetical protein [Caulobacteraceae bacterium]
MTDSLPGNQGEWWRDRVWDLQARVSSHEARIEALHGADKEHRDDIHDLRREMTLLRQEMAKGFADLSVKMDLHLGSMRAEISELRNLPPLTPPIQTQTLPQIPIRWIVIGGLALVGAIASASFALGVMSDPKEAFHAATSALTQ